MANPSVDPVFDILFPTVNMEVKGTQICIYILLLVGSKIENDCVNRLQFTMKAHGYMVPLTPPFQTRSTQWLNTIIITHKYDFLRKCIAFLFVFA